MKKKVFTRALSGAPIGIAIGFIITIIISACIGDGNYYPCVPSFTEHMGNELNAVILQTLLCGIMGAGYAAASLIWESEKLSIAARTGLALLVYLIITLPTAYFAEWMHHSIFGALSYILIYLTIFVSIWLAQYLVYKSNIKKINQKLQ